ncbi:MAG: hypothetical protein A3K12_04160 [Candidatus Rokubacteria bacterium RIFCSPLOWO2_12_FULL_71_19]|nr:MAG: hypothetical protein A3K12_04160 [Candidatus Rokubacteria bacterium RIFCSPLOWO2_12_FULL_71_19]
MPNGHAGERDAVWQRSRCWGIVWQIGDAAYYLGLLGSIILPLAVAAMSLGRSWSGSEWRGSLGLAVLLLLGCFPAGLGACIVLKGLARRRTGVERR